MKFTLAILAFLFATAFCNAQVTATAFQPLNTINAGHGDHCTDSCRWR